MAFVNMLMFFVAYLVGEWLETLCLAMLNIPIDDVHAPWTVNIKITMDKPCRLPSSSLYSLCHVYLRIVPGIIHKYDHLLFLRWTYSNHFATTFPVLTFLSVSAVKIGISSSLAFYLIAISNATSAIGRILGGIYAFKYGPINALIAFTSVAAICTFIWPFIISETAFIVITCFYG